MFSPGAVSALGRSISKPLPILSAISPVPLSAIIAPSSVWNSDLSANRTTGVCDSNTLPTSVALDLLFSDLFVGSHCAFRFGFLQDLHFASRKVISPIMVFPVHVPGMNGLWHCGHFCILIIDLRCWGQNQNNGVFEDQNST